MLNLNNFTNKYLTEFFNLFLKIVKKLNCHYLNLGILRNLASGNNG